MNLSPRPESSVLLKGLIEITEGTPAFFPNQIRCYPPHSFDRMIVLFVAALHLVGAAALLHPQHQASSARASSAPPFPYGFALGSSTARVPLGDPLQYHGVVALPPGLGQARDEGRAAEPFCQGVALACAVAPLAARRARGLMGGSFLASWLGTTMAFFTSLHGDPGLAHLCLALGLPPRLCVALIFWPTER